MAYRKNKNVDNRAYKFRLLPNAEQTVLINKTFGCVRFVYNSLLADKNAYYKYKSERAGKHFIKIDRWFASTKTCCNCGYKNDDITLKTREWICPGCNTHHHRDHNAAINIKREGYKAVLAM